MGKAKKLRPSLEAAAETVSAKAGADRNRVHAAGFPSHTPAHRNEQTRPSVDPQLFKRKGSTAGPAATGCKPVRRATDCAPARAVQPCSRAHAD